MSKDKAAATEFAQSTKFKCKDGYVVCVVNKKLDKDIAESVKKSGANAVFMQEEVFTTSKLELAITQTVKSAYLIIKSSDLTVGVELTFNVFHYMPLRGKYVFCALEGMVLTQEKLDKLTSVGELYVRREDCQKFNQYSADHQDLSAGGLARRCRAQYLALYAKYMDLAFLLTDQSENASFAKGAALIATIRTIVKELYTTMGTLGDAWSVVNNSAIGDAGTCERAPGLAAYVALFGLLVNLKDTEEAMVASLLSELGVLLLPPAITKKIRAGALSTLNAEEMAMYRSYPLLSLDMVLSRKIGLVDAMRNIIVSVQERCDGSGFPKGLKGPKVSDAAQLIQFCRLIDSLSVIRAGQPRPTPEHIKQKVLDSGFFDSGVVSIIFGQKIREVLP